LWSSVFVRPLLRQAAVPAWSEWVSDAMVVVVVGVVRIDSRSGVVYRLAIAA
jgi:hypothetical protein